MPRIVSLAEKAYFGLVFFSLLKAYARLALKLWCRKLVINKPQWLQAKGPLLIAANHPNSFLDGILLMTLFQNPMYTLARGDAFKKPWHNKLLRGLHLLPVYRTSEGVENLTHNYTTFAACRDVFAQKGIVMIFSEGRCINEWHLRPLKKGTARLALSAWNSGVPLTVVPLGFNYSSFRRWGKTIHLNFGTPLQQEAILKQDTDGKQALAFNAQLESELERLVYEIKRDDGVTAKKRFFVPTPAPLLFLLAIPALLSMIVHAPLYFAARLVANIFFDNDHYDSVLVALLMLVYPLYLLTLTISVGVAAGGLWALALFFGLPLSARALVYWKHHLEFR